MRKLAHSIAQWFSRRLELGDTVRPLLAHPVPPGVNWWYVFGSATLTLFILLAVTGTVLATVYVPSAAGAYGSLQELNQNVPLGWWIRAIHNAAASGMVVMIGVHMTQVFVFGAYKYPRELTWLVGVVLFMLTLGMAFSGQVLRFDLSSYWGISVLVAMVGRVPWIGPWLVRTVLGGPYISGATVSRFFAVHVFFIPGLLVLLIGLHLYLVVKRGISEPPERGQTVDPETYDERYEKLLERGEPFYPRPFWKDGVFSALVVLAVVGIAAYVGPHGPSGAPDPTTLHAVPRPDWYFLPLFALLALVPPSWETAIMLGLPVVLVLALGVVPFVFRGGERAPSRRPGAIVLVTVVWGSLAALLWLGKVAPWSPHMDAWTSAPWTAKYVRHRTPLQLQGAVLVQYKNCRNCHQIGGAGGLRGPSLDGVATRLSRDELVRQIVQGGGNMPAFGQHLTSAEVKALVAYLVTLDGQPSSARSGAKERAGPEVAGER